MGVTPKTQSEPRKLPPGIGFRKTWRSYQQRVLDSLDYYLEDRKVHIVAAPGSGKTVLGLEIVRRIDQPALILTPTLTIRDQWVQRFCDSFLAAGEPVPQYISTDLHRPASITVSTYQALHCACTGVAAPEHETEEAGGNHDLPNGAEIGAAALPPELIDAGFGTLVVDEAHHLRAEWWKVLTATAEQLKEPVIIALTATPPYDVPAGEWERYQEFCGAVDAEVSIPELVQNGDLCPHQDYVYLTAPAPRELDAILKYQEGVSRIFHDLCASPEFASAVAAHPWLRQPTDNYEEMLDNPPYLSSLLIYLHHVQRPVPPAALEAMGITTDKLPKFNLEWAEVLLTNALYADAANFASIESWLKPLKHSLQSINAIERRRITLREPSSVAKLLTTSVTKLDAIREIVQIESAALKQELRLVVLTDFIRKDELPKTADEQIAFEDIGVVPIFETLRRSRIEGIRLAALSGSLVVVPAGCEARLRAMAIELGIPARDIHIEPAAHDNGYALLQVAQDHQLSVRLVTQLFAEGEITVLVGTKSLLGEGWDAPAINTLILASFVGSYMLSNQMRGRSIRKDPANPAKTANIWHLVCLQPGLLGPGDDYLTLCRRFKAFTGVSFEKVGVENGVARLGLAKAPFTREEMQQFNEGMRRRALDRGGLRQRWTDALLAGVRIVEGVAAPEAVLPRRAIIDKTLAALALQALGWGAVVLYMGLNGLRGMRNANFKVLMTYLVIVLGVAATATLPLLLKVLWLYIKHGSLERSLQQVGNTVLQALIGCDAVQSDPKRLRVVAVRDGGTATCWLEGATSRESAVFMRAVRDLLEPVQNPRYLLARTRRFLGFLGEKFRWLTFLREDYHAVPDIIGRKKDSAEEFARLWRRNVGGAELIYTRTPEGRRALLRARGQSLAAALRPKCERVSCWR